MSLKLLLIKKLAKMKESRYLGTFIQCLSSFQLKNKTGKNQRVRDKTYKVVNFISRCASIISMDISMDLSMDIHIHGKAAFSSSFNAF